MTSCVTLNGLSIEFEINTTHLFPATFKQWNGSAYVNTDPTTVRARFEAPSGLVYTLVYGVDAELVRVTTGEYYALFVPDETAEWEYSFKGEGVVVAEFHNTFYVKEPLVIW